ncbi:MAG: pantetheine-phosphate adenylyltransferase [Gemmatimonadota bacterium]|nr:pantetheine-phosphate adenylyltransferase [Gemmatimonadota bacterium]MDQ8167117.1 pantetheine-phosphate adenylyltransferase [Gemmatimonadota bacterium]MDQ8172210.1 pantetheine-phosphate adenylyltransferase [Gemmatimonadota bacterium]
MTSSSVVSAERVALYAGSFDPVTHGHEDLIRRTLTFADRVIVAVANNVSKQPLFSVDARVQFITDIMGHDRRVEVRAFSGLLVDFARDVGAQVNVRGLRAVSDFEYEFQMALMNRHLYPDMETVFMTPSLDTTYISSSMVREVARFGGDVSGLVHPIVAAALGARFAGTR